MKAKIAMAASSREKKNVIIVSGLQLCDNPRVVKEADTLAAAGYEVTVLTAHYSSEGAARSQVLRRDAVWKAEVLIDAASRNIANRVDWTCRRIWRRLTAGVCRIFKTEHVSQLSYCAESMLRYCKSNPAALYIVHVDAAVWVGSRLIELGRRVAIDMEDWHSEDLRAEDRRYYPSNLVRNAEAIALRGCAYASTTSSALAEALSASVDCQPPIVLYNAFRLSERRNGKDPPHEMPPSNTLPRIGWVSQVIGPDRGLEQLVESTQSLKHPIEIHLTGRLRPGMAESLKLRLHPASQIVFQDQVPHDKLLPLMQTYGIGFAGELAHNRSRDLTVTNKILHYFLAGIPAVCSDTLGQMEVCRQVPEACRVYSQRDPISLAAAIDSLLDTPESLRNAKRAAWDAGSTKFCWEANEPRLLEAVRSAIGDP